MAKNTITAQTGRASTVKGLFSRETSVSIYINAAPSIVWALLANAADYPRWNSTVVSIQGEITGGKKIKVVSRLAPTQTFFLTVKEFNPVHKLVWGDAMGNRIYTLTQNAHGTTFLMREKIGGPLFPLFAKMIPAFDKPFEQFAADLKKEAETIMYPK